MTLGHFCLLSLKKNLTSMFYDSLSINMNITTVDYICFLFLIFTTLVSWVLTTVTPVPDA